MSLDLHVHPTFWPAFRDFLDAEPGTMDVLTFLDAPGRLEGPPGAPPFQLWDHADAPWLALATAPAFDSQDPTHIIDLLSALLHPDALHTGLQTLAEDALAAPTRTDAARLRRIIAMADHAGLPLSLPEGAHAVLQGMRGALEGLADALQRMHRSLSYAGIRVVWLTDPHEALADPEAFARERLRFDPVHAYRDTVLTWHPHPLSPDTFADELTAWLTTLGRPTPRLRDALEHLSLAIQLHPHRSLGRPEAPLTFQALQSAYPLTCCGSRQWMVCIPDRSLVIQAYRYC